jgi:hypothetical protein
LETSIVAESSTAWQPPRFDDYQFARGKARAVSPETELSFSDLKHMHIYRRKKIQERKQPTPSWVDNAEETRRVLLVYLERRVYINVPDETKSYEQRLAAVRERAALLANALRGKLEALLRRFHATQGELIAEGVKSLQIEIQNVDTQIQMLARLPGIVASIPYFYYKLGWDSVTVAEELKLKPAGVRRILFRLNHVALVLHGEIPQKARVHKHWILPATRIRKTSKKWPRERLQVLYEAYMRRNHVGGIHLNTWKEIGQLLSVDRTQASRIGKTFLILPKQKNRVPQSAKRRIKCQNRIGKLSRELNCGRMKSSSQRGLAWVLPVKPGSKSVLG